MALRPSLLAICICWQLASWPPADTWGQEGERFGQMAIRFDEPGSLRQVTAKYMRLDSVHPDYGEERHEVSIPFREGWTVDKSELRLSAPEGQLFALATLNQRFKAIESISIRGAITKSGSSFRVSSGNVLLILNWEDAKENHILIGGKRSASNKPHALELSKKHQIELTQHDERVEVSIDGTEIFLVTGRLKGFVEIATFAGGAIAIEDIIVGGTLEE